MKEPLLLVHGFTDTKATWTPLIPLLAPHHELLVPTLTGHHGGPPIPAGMANPIATMADDLEQTLDEAGHEKAHIVGNSLGGWLSFELGRRGRALTVVALSPALGWEGERPPARTERLFVRAHRAGRYAVKRAEFLARRPGLRKLAFREVVAHPERMKPRTAYELIIGSADCAMFDPFREHLDKGGYRGEFGDLGVPTRIAWGEHDRTLPFRTCSSWFRNALPEAEWVDLADCGHLPHHDDSELVARTILEVTARAREPEAQLS